MKAGVESERRKVVSLVLAEEERVDRNQAGQSMFDLVEGLWMSGENMSVAEKRLCTLRSPFAVGPAFSGALDGRRLAHLDVPAEQQDMEQLWLVDSRRNVRRVGVSWL